jgi:hypothetical protein
MAKRPSLNNEKNIKSKPKVTRQGKSNNTKVSASSGNSKEKKYRGQG